MCAELSYEKQIPRCARNDKTFHAPRCARWKRSELAPIGLPERLGQAGLRHLLGGTPGRASPPRRGSEALAEWARRPSRVKSARVATSTGPPQTVALGSD